jgi:hypothetical protein
MNLSECFKKLDMVDVFLILTIVFLLYSTFSNNFEYSEHSGFVDTVVKDVENVGKEVEQVVKDAVPTNNKDKNVSGSDNNYDNTFDVEQAPVKYELKPAISEDKGTYKVVGLTDHSDNMGLNLNDLGKPLVDHSNIKVYNSSTKALTENVPQNLLSSASTFDNRMDTLNLMKSSEKVGDKISEKVGEGQVKEDDKKDMPGYTPESAAPVENNK